MTEMFLVQYWYGSYSDYSETNLFVTADQELAAAFVRNAEREIAAAQAIKRPQWVYGEDIAHGGTRDVEGEMLEYSHKLKSAMTLLPELADSWYIEEVGIGYFPIEVR